MTLPLYGLAALLEIAGCFAVWSWARGGASPLWLLPGTAALLSFAWLLTRSEAAFAGRAYAAYGGVYVSASLLWLWTVEGQRPDRWDLAGGTVVLLGAALILAAPRAG